jgi:hypothetical protein
MLHNLNITNGKNTQSKNISFNLNGNIIKTEDEVKLLGVTIDYELKFNSHITNICRKASRQQQKCQITGQ